MSTYNIYLALIVQLDKLARHNRQGSFQTKRRYYEAMQRFCRYLAEEFHLQKLSNISGKHFVAYVEHLQNRCKAASTIKTDLAAIRFFHDKMEHAKYRLPDNDALGVALERRRFGGVDRTWSAVEFNRMIGKAVEAGRDDIAFALYLGRFSGLRIHEVMRIDTATAEQALREDAITIKGKGGKMRTVPIEDERVRVALEAMLKRTERGHKLFVPDGVPTDRAINGVQLFKPCFSRDTEQGWYRRVFLGNHRARTSLVVHFPKFLLEKSTFEFSFRYLSQLLDASTTQKVKKLKKIC